VAVQFSSSDPIDRSIQTYLGVQPNRGRRLLEHRDALAIMRSAMSPHASKLATAIAVCAWLLPACAERDESLQTDSSAEVESQASQPAVAPAELRVGDELADPRVQALRALGYAGQDKPSGAGKAKNAPAKAEAKAPDAAALSELEYQTAQSMNQRANEAFDYLGVASFEAPSKLDNLETEGNRAARAPRARPESDGKELETLLEEAGRFRDQASASPMLEKKLVGRLVARRQRADDSDRLAKAGEAPAHSEAQRFVRERRSLEGLSFRAASGYWANTYVPVDPVMRLLESRLGKRDRSALQAFAPRQLLLEAASHQTPQPFDPPSRAALSVFVQADRRGLEGERRMLVQVGLQGAERRSGLRPAMSVGIVLDVRGSVSTEIATAMRALMDGFLEAKDVGDRFSLTVVGEPGGTLISPDEFRHGPISLAMARLVEPGSSGHPGEHFLDLEEAVHTRSMELRRSDAPAAPLGSSMVFLVTSQPFGSLTTALAAIAHESAVAGVPVSVVGIGEQVQLAEIERVALAGQGNRRLMHAAAEAERLVQRELSALSRVIARALRLRIRLAPGVKLIEVVGSERLDAAGAQQVRAAEKSIDRRLARNLGIEADRGEDEEGIQIVMPTFHSGDAHAVLLDVVAPGPGPIADVTVRYKDLVYLRNSVARANLTLGRSSEPPGPLERNVVKNLLAIRLSETLKQAGRDLMAGGDAHAIASVRRFQALLQGVQREVPGFQNDADLADDAGMLGEYLAVLDAGALQQAEPRQYLADSLQLSGYFKTVPRSTSDPRVARR
jgi:hypothetical protein